MILLNISELKKNESKISTLLRIETKKIEMPKRPSSTTTNKTDEQPPKCKSRTSSSTQTSDEEKEVPKQINPLAPFENPWKGSDVVLIVEDKELHAHSSILATASDYFQKMFDGNFKEADTKRVTLEEQNHEIMEHVLKLVYPMTNGFGKFFLFEVFLRFCSAD